jgi:hypothetical protein
MDHVIRGGCDCDITILVSDIIFEEIVIKKVCLSHQKASDLRFDTTEQYIGGIDSLHTTIRLSRLDITLLRYSHV